MVTPREQATTHPPITTYSGGSWKVPLGETLHIVSAKQIQSAERQADIQQQVSAGVFQCGLHQRAIRKKYMPLTKQRRSKDEAKPITPE